MPCLVIQQRGLPNQQSAVSCLMVSAMLKAWKLAALS
jgi:hypothetical protein